MTKKDIRKATEIELVEMAKSEVKETAEKAFAEIHKRFNKSISYFLLKRIHGIKDCVENHEDLVQTVFERAFKNIGTFEPTFKMSTWLMRIAKNLSIDHFRKTKPMFVEMNSEDEDGNDTTMDIEDNTFNPERLAEKGERNQFVRDLIKNKLSADYQEVIKLYFFDGKSYDEIAEELEIPLGTVKAKLFRAKQLLKEGLTEDVLLNA